MFHKDPKMPNSCVISNDGNTWLYWQNGGCLEIGQLSEEHGVEVQDLIHIHSDEVEAFVKELVLFCDGRHRT